VNVYDICDTECKQFLEFSVCVTKQYTKLALYR